MESVDKPLKFKQLTAENWLECPPSPFVWVNQAGNETPITATDWLKEFLLPQLPNSIPEGVRELYEVARGCMIYGCFFYPLYTVGHNNLFLVLDAATIHRCTEFGMAKAEKAKYIQRIEFLFRLGVLDQEDEQRWKAAKSIRNHAVHRTSQMLLPPNYGLNGLWAVRQDLIKLFSNDFYYRNKCF